MVLLNNYNLSQIVDIKLKLLTYENIRDFYDILFFVFLNKNDTSSLPFLWNVTFV